MLYDIDLISLETAIRDHIGEEIARLWPRTNIFRAINAEVSRITRDVIELDQGYFEVLETLTPSSNAITLPSRLYKIRAVEVYADSMWRPIPFRGVADKFITNNISDSSYVSSVRFSGNTLVFDPSQGSITSVRVYYAEVAPPMIYGTATAGGTSSITFTEALPVDDIYNRTRIQIIEGTGVGQQNTVSDYVGSTQVATVTAWTTTPSTDSVYSTILPTPLDRWPEVIVLGAAMRLLLRRRDDTLIGMIREQYLKDYSAMMTALKRRQGDQPPRVRMIYNHDELVYGG